MLSFTLLGRTELRKEDTIVRGFRSQKELAILIYLAQTGQTHRRDTLADLLWDNGSTKQALSNVRTAVARLQTYIGDALVVTSRTLALAPEHGQQIDSVRLLQALANVGPVTSAEQALVLQGALDSYCGDFLAGFQLRNAPRFDEWATLTREQIRRDVLAAYRKLGQYALSSGEGAWGVALARRWLQVDALDESAHTLLVRRLIESGNLREAVAHYERCVALLRTELGAPPPEALTELIKAARPAPAASPRPNAPAHHNLPPSYDQFFGRELVQEELHQRLDQPWCRLVTILGPGGVGKTRLATSVARNRIDRFPDGVWLVELASLDPQDDDLAEAIAVEIASVLNLRFAGSAPPVDQLLNHLLHKHMLLVLDNVEHLLGGVQIVLDIVQRCERVQLLVTSREPLQLRAEWTVGLTGLSYPRSETDLAPTEAVALFVARWSQRHWDTLSADDMDAIRTICRKVEGLPLAIELAAALTRTATPQAVAVRIQHGFDALTTSLRDVPQRHHSLQIVFEMSWRTLAPALQQRLARLALFRGGFTAPAAQQIAAVDAGQLAALVEKSLLGRSETLDRYTLHPVVRAYAAERLPPGDPTADQHTAYYLALLAQHTAPLQGNRPQVSITTLEPDIDNLRLAWQTGLGQRRAAELLAALSSLSLYYQLRGLAGEGEAVMQATVARASEWSAEGVVLAARAGLEQARFLNRLGRYWPATLTVKAALQLAVQSGDRWAEGMAQVWWGESLWRLGEHESARTKLAQALTIGEAIGSASLVGWCHHHLGIVDDIQGRYETALDHLQRASTAWRRLENANTLSVSLNSLGLVLFHQGNLPAAQQHMDQALALCTQVDNRHLQALLLNNLSMVAIQQGDYLGAHSYLHLGLDLALVSGNLTGQAEISINVGRNHRQLGEAALATESLEQGLRIAETLGNRTLMALAMLHLAEVQHEQGHDQRAEASYSRALHIAEQDHLSYIKCDLLIGMAELLSDTSRSRARQYSAEAVALAESLGNQQLLERANRVAAHVHLPTHPNKQTLSA